MSADVAREVWLRMSDLVLDNRRQREVTQTLGMTFGRTRAIRRLARQPMSMREFAAAMGIEAPNATVMVDDLEAAGLVERRPHPTDRRAKLVEATAEGKVLAAKADEILSTPPEGLTALSDEELETLRGLLARAAG
jgi:DNA-binding MarR family transcriptional regulator